MNRIFKDDHLEQTLCEKGYLKLPLLKPEQCDELLAYYKELTQGEHVSNSKYGLYVTLEEFDTEKSLEVEEWMDEYLKDELNKYFEPYKSHLGGFLVKRPDPNAYTYPHQDWTFVDHSAFKSVTVWIALMPISRKNSTLGFAPGSVPYFNELPVGTPVTVLKSGTFGHEKKLYEHMDIVDLAPGEAMVFDNRIVHAATPNISTADRIAYALTLSPPEAPLIHYVQVPSSGENRKLAKLAVDRKFFHDYTIDKADEYYEKGELPEGYEVLEVSEEPYAAPGEEYIDHLIAQNHMKKNGLMLGGATDTDQPKEEKSGFLNTIGAWLKMR